MEGPEGLTLESNAKGYLAALYVSHTSMPVVAVVSAVATLPPPRVLGGSTQFILS